MCLPDVRASAVTDLYDEAIRIDLHGKILEPWYEADEDAIFAHGLAYYASAWQHEDEPPRELSLEPTERAHREAITAYLREHGEAQAKEVARALWRFGGLAVVRQRLGVLEREGVVRRGLSVGRYRLA